MWFFAACSAALAGPGDVDLHGPFPAPVGAEPAQPLRTWSPWVVEQDAAGVVFEYARDPLSRYDSDGGGDERVRLLGDVVVGHVSAIAGLGRFALGADLPVMLADGGPGLGDLKLAAPIALLPEHLAIVPHVRFATGRDGVYVGDAGTGVGALISGAYRYGPWVATGHTGLEWRETDDVLVPAATTEWVGAFALGVVPIEALGIHAEVLSSYRGDSGPFEGTLSSRLRVGRLFVTGGGGGSFNGVPGAPLVRAFVGVGGSFSPIDEPALVPIVSDTPEPPPSLPEAALPPVDVSVNVRDMRGDAVPTARVVFRSDAEVVPGVAAGAAFTARLAPGAWDVEVDAPGLGTQARRLVATSGVPLDVEAILLDVAGSSTLAVTLIDPEQRPVSDARVLVDGLLVGTTSTGGTLTLGALAAGPHLLDVSGHGYRQLHVETEVASEVKSDLPLVLLPTIGMVRVVVRGPSGPVPDATVSFDGPLRRPAVQLGVTGERVVVLGEGHWRAVVASASNGLQTREIVVGPDDRAEARVEVVYLPFEAGTSELGLRLVDASGAPVARAAIEVDGAHVGTSSTGGALTLATLAPGARHVRIRGDSIQPLERTVLLDQGAREETMVLQWVEGATRIRVSTADTPVGDATVSARGATPVAPFPVGPNGEHLTALPPGQWTLTVSSPTAGIQSRRVVVAPGGRSLAQVDFLLGSVPVGAALGDVTLLLTDPVGGAVDRADVALDAEPRGSTQAGHLELTGVVPGQRTLTLQATALAPTDRRVEVVPGPQEVAVTMPWRHAVRVEVRGPDGPAADAVVRLFGGGTAISPRLVGADGAQIVGVPPGRWQIVASSAALGLGTTTVEVLPDSGLTPATIDVGRSGASDVLVLVQDPLGQPIPDADVACDGCPSVAAGSEGVVLMSGVAAGSRNLEVSAPNFASRNVSADLQGGDEQRVVRLEPIPAAVRVTTTDEAGAPVDALVKFMGPYKVPGAQLGPTGTAELSLLPGRWEVTAEAQGYAALRRELSVAPGDVPADVSFVLRPGTVQVVAGEINFGEQVHFDLGSAVLRPDSEAMLKEVADTLIAHGELVRVEVQGHTDASGDIPLNQALSQARAQAVRDALVRLGVAAERLVAAGYGPTRPVASNTDDEGRQRNRRVQFEVLERSAD